MHIWPFLIALVPSTCLTVSASTLSSARIAGHLPPSSSVTGHELLGGGLGDLAADRRAAGVEQVVPAHACEGLRELEAADDHVDPVAVERRADHLAQQLAAGGRVLRGLDHDAVAGGEHLDQRADGQVEREVPRHDVADHALRLGLDERAARSRTAPGRRVAARAPSTLSSCSAAYAGAARPGRAPRSGRWPARGCTPKSLLIASWICGAVAEQHPGERAEQRLALLQRGERVGQERRALARDDLARARRSPRRPRRW